jgi:predicted PurR-regulated permease PerM
MELPAPAEWLLAVGDYVWLVAIVLALVISPLVGAMRRRLGHDKQRRKIVVFILWEVVVAMVITGFGISIILACIYLTMLKVVKSITDGT